jgi:hypothetical protein
MEVLPRPALGFRPRHCKHLPFFFFFFYTSPLFFSFFLFFFFFSSRFFFLFFSLPELPPQNLTCLLTVTAWPDLLPPVMDLSLSHLLPGRQTHALCMHLLPRTGHPLLMDTTRVLPLDPHSGRPGPSFVSDRPGLLGSLLVKYVSLARHLRLQS